MKNIAKLVPLFLVCLPAIAAAHHSNAEWDSGVKLELEGEIVAGRIVFRNEEFDAVRVFHMKGDIDPATFTRPARRTSDWVAVPGIEVRPYDLDCDVNPWIPAQ